MGRLELLLKIYSACGGVGLDAWYLNGGDTRSNTKNNKVTKANQEPGVNTRNTNTLKNMRVEDVTAKALRYCYQNS